MKKITTYSIFLLLLLNVNVKAQDNDTLEIQRNEKGTVQFARFMVNARSDRKMENDTIFLKSILKAKKEDGFRVIQKNTDELGITHKKFQQYYLGMKVENAEFLIHGKNGNIDVINGDFQEIILKTTSPSITEPQALVKAIEFVGAKKYKWEIVDMENFVKQNTNNPKATYYPKGELVISKDYLNGSNAFKLAWKFTISSMEPNNEQLIYVDANDGNIINNVPLIQDINITCNAQTLYSGNQTITGDTYTGGIRLQEIRNNVNIQTLNLHNSYNYSNATDFANSNTNWVSGSWLTFNQDQWALDVHWGAEKVLDFWRASPRNRNSIDGNGLRVLSYVHTGSSWPNAQWVNGSNNNFMQYGDGDATFRPLTALDICAHEFGHGITQFTANLTPGTQESGALNEGFSDIWGACVEHWAAPNKQTWLIGEEIFYSSTYTCLRDLQNPKSTTAQEGQHPDTYHGTNWDNNGEPHTNSTVLSHWFYLLSQGGTGSNDLGNTYSVSGVSIDVAQQIVYSTVLSYLYSSANYTAARNASIQAAIALYGVNTCQVKAVTDAWYAVGVGGSFQYSNVNISGPSLVCVSGSTYSVNLPSGKSVVWGCSSNLVKISSSVNTAVFEPNGSGPGQIWATITSTTCGNVTLPAINVTASPGPISIDFDAPPGRFTAMIDAVPSATSYKWYCDGVLNSSTTTIARFTRQSENCEHVYYVDVIAVNTCESGLSHAEVSEPPCDYYSIFPNPASTEITITQNTSKTASVQSIKKPIKEVRIIDKFGRQALTQSFGDEVYETKLNISNLQTGSYTIQINQGTEMETYTVIKE